LYRHKFLAEFLEVGGALTVVEILGVKQAREADKAEALRLLTCIASAGRQYKELICESYGLYYQRQLTVLYTAQFTIRLMLNLALAELDF
jgi:hypothetical protein